MAELVKADRRACPPNALRDEQKRGSLRLIASPDGADGSVRIQQDARVFAALLDSGRMLTQAIAPGRKAWLHVARGHTDVNGAALKAGDRAAIENETSISIGSSQGGEVLLFVLAR